MRPRPRVSLPTSLAWFFLVGAGALIVETTWMRWLRPVMGATAPAVSACLVAITLGQLLGAVLGGRLSARSANATRVFAIVMLAAAAAALLVEALLISLTPLIDRGSAAVPEARTAVRLAGALGATLPASIAIGTAFPLLVTATSERASELGAHGTKLYAADLFGAALGAGLTAFWLPARLGVRGAYLVGVVGFVVVALFALVVQRRVPHEVAPVDTGEASARLPAGIAVASVISGFGVFAAQLLFHQAFGRVLDQSTFALGAVLVATLVFLALGTSVVSALEASVSSTAILVAASGVAAIGFAAFPRLFSVATDGLSIVAGEGATGYVPTAMLLCAITAGPALVGAAAVLPSLFVITGAQAEGDGRHAGHLAGKLLAANTIGAVVGALAAPFGLLPTLSLWPTFLVLALVYAGLSIAAGRRVRYAWAASVVLLSAIALCTPWRVAPLRLAPGDRLVEASTSAQGLVAVIQRGPERLLQTDNHYVLGGTADSVHQERQGHLPLLLHPSPKRVAFFGTATGSSAGAALRHDVERLVTVEIMPGVAEAARTHFGDANARVYDDRRTEVVTDDARSFFRSDESRFDVIVGDLFVPWRSETGALYTRSHFERVKQRLAPGGIYSQWLPLYQLSPSELDTILATFLDVFPDAQVYRGDFYGQYGIVGLVGSGGGVPISTEGVSVRAAALGRAGVHDRWMIHPDGVPALYVGPLSALGPQLKRVPRNTVNRPVIEFAAAANAARHTATLGWTVAGDAWLARVRALRATPGASVWPSEDGKRAAEGGRALQAASVHWTLDRSDEAAEALLQAGSLLSPELLADAPPDPTAADVWHVGPSR